MKVTHFLLALACASALLLGWGCKKSTDSKNDTVTIAYVTNGVDPFWDLCAAGVRIAEKEFNIPKNEPKSVKQNLNVLEGKEKKEFLEGAEIAYETILTSFAKGETNKLKTLLTTPMAKNFSEAIEARTKENIKSEFMKTF